MDPNSINNTNTMGAVKLSNAAGGFTNANAKDEVKRIEPSNPFVKFGYIIFTVTMLISLGIFFYNRYLIKSSEGTLDSVIKYRDKISKMPLADIHQLLDRLVSFNDIATKHTYVTTIFNFLEVVTNKNVYWSQVDLRAKDKDKYEMVLAGNSNSYYSVIQQMDELKSDKYKEYISNVEMSGISRTKDELTGKVTVKFSVKMKILKPFANINFDNYLYGAIDNANIVNPAEDNVPVIKVIETDLPIVASTTIETSTNNIATTTKNIKVKNPIPIKKTTPLIKKTP